MADAGCRSGAVMGGDAMRNMSVMDPVFRRNVEHLVALGPRAIAEFLIETGRANGCSDEIGERLTSYRRISPEMLTAVSGDEFPRLIWRAA